MRIQTCSIRFVERTFEDHDTGAVSKSQNVLGNELDVSKPKFWHIYGDGEWNDEVIKKCNKPRGCLEDCGKNNNNNMVCCDGCGRWCHFKCTKMDVSCIKDSQDFICSQCDLKIQSSNNSDCKEVFECESDNTHESPIVIGDDSDNSDYKEKEIVEGELGSIPESPLVVSGDSNNRNCSEVLECEPGNSPESPVGSGDENNRECMMGGLSTEGATKLQDEGGNDSEGRDRELSVTSKKDDVEESVLGTVVTEVPKCIGDQETRNVVNEVVAINSSGTENNQIIKSFKAVKKVVLHEILTASLHNKFRLNSRI